MFEGGCEIWIARLAEFAEHQGSLDAVLTPDERSHVDRVHRGQATARLSRGLLRLVLARYLHLTAAEIGIDRSCPECGRAHGRPRLYSPSEPVEFSVTHGGDLLVLAFAERGPIGVDVEPIGAIAGVGPELVEYVLTPVEAARLQELPAAERRRSFLRHWTAKEAVLKALGTGLDVEPQAVALPSFPTTGPVSLTLSESTPVELWLTDVEVGPEDVCTLATGWDAHRPTAHRLRPELVLGAGP